MESFLLSFKGLFTSAGGELEMVYNPCENETGDTESENMPTKWQTDKYKKNLQNKNPERESSVARRRRHVSPGMITLLIPVLIVAVGSRSYHRFLSSKPYLGRETKQVGTFTILREQGKGIFLDSDARSLSDNENLDEYSESEHNESQSHESASSPKQASPKNLTVLAAAAVLLIALSRIFEAIQRYVASIVSKEVLQIVNTLYAELTIQGFIAVCFYILEVVGVVDDFAVVIYGEEHAPELKELFDMVHYGLFCIIFFFVFQIFVLLEAAHETERQWNEQDAECRENILTDFLPSLKQQKRFLYERSQSQRLQDETGRRSLFWCLVYGLKRFLFVCLERCCWCCCRGRSAEGVLCSRTRSSDDEDEENKKDWIREQAIFCGIRKEFILERSVDPPFEPAAAQWQSRRQSQTEAQSHLKSATAAFLSSTVPLTTNASQSESSAGRRESTGPVNEQKHEEHSRLHLDYRTFCFGRYLTLAQSHMLMNVVEIESATWLFFAIVTVLFYGLALLLQNQMEILAGIWVGLGWSLLLFNFYFERHLVLVRNKFLPKRVLAALTNAGHDIDIEHADWNNDPTEASKNDALMIEECHGDSGYFPFSSGQHNPETQQEPATAADCAIHTHPDGELPPWCDVDLAHYMEVSRSWLARKFVGGMPTRQEVFFWLDRKGPHLYLFVLQVNLLFTGIYVAFIVSSFYPMMFKLYSPWVSTAYLVTAAIPAIGLTYNKRVTLAMMTQICSIGGYRKLHLIGEVLREEKIVHLIRTFLVIAKMRRYAVNFGTAPSGTDPAMTSSSSILDGSTGNNGESELERRRKKRGWHYSESFGKLEVDQIVKTFNDFDTDQSGSITAEEFGQLMSKIGLNEISPAHTQKIVEMLDMDGDGEIQREEFLQWYAQQAGKDNGNCNSAKDLFFLFDQNHSGEITMGSFKAKIDALGVDFSLDEVGVIVSEMDEDRNGTISLEEFEKFVNRYYPKELFVNTNQTEDQYHPMMC